MIPLGIQHIIFETVNVIIWNITIELAFFKFGFKIELSDFCNFIMIFEYAINTMKVAPNCNITTKEVIILIKYMELVGSTKGEHVVEGIIIFEYFIITHITTTITIETMNLPVSHFTANCLLLYLAFRGKTITRHL